MCVHKDTQSTYTHLYEIYADMKMYFKA